MEALAVNMVDDRGAQISTDLLAGARRAASSSDHAEPMFRRIEIVLSSTQYGNRSSALLRPGMPLRIAAIITCCLVFPLLMALVPNPHVHALGIGLLMPLMVFTIMRTSQPAAALIRTRTYVYAGLCGQCGFNLKGLVTQPDGCVICPECAAAWHEESIAPVEFIDRVAAIPPHSFLRVTRSSIIDARGRAVLLAMPDLRELPFTERAAIHPNHLNFIRHASGGVMSRLLLVIVAAVMLLSATMQIISRAAGAKPSVLATFGTTSLIICSLILLAHYLPRAIDQLQITDVRRFAAALLTTNRCPSCARTFTNSPDPTLGTRRCIHCRSEWSIDLITFDAQTAQDRTNDRLRSLHNETSTPVTQA